VVFPAHGGNVTTPLIAIVVTSLSYLCVILSGVWLMKYGRPYNGFITTVHKLISIACAIYIVIFVKNTTHFASMTVTEIAISVITVGFFVGAVVSGGVLTLERHTPLYVVTIHKVTSVLTLGVTGIVLYLLLQGSV
jgi:hypothetical protein